MKLYVDLETLQLIEAPGFRSPVTSLRFKRGDAATLEVAFLSSSASVYSLIGDRATLAMQFGIKAAANYAGGYLVHATTWVMPADGAVAPVYVCAPSFNTTELNTALRIGASPELATLTAMAEITWVDAAGSPVSTRTFEVVIENDVNRGTEGTPQSNPTPEDWLSAHAPRIDTIRPLTPTELIFAKSNFGDEPVLDPVVLDPAPFSYATAVWEKAFHGQFCTATSPALSLKTSTGYAKAIRWDGAMGVKAPTSGGASGTNIVPSFGTAIASPYNGRLIKGFGIYPCDSSSNSCDGITYNGDITLLAISGLCGADVSNLTELTSLLLTGGTYGTLDLRKCTKLVTLLLESPALTDLRLPATLPLLTTLTIKRFRGKRLDLRAFTAITYLDIEECLNLTEIDLSACTALTQINVVNCPKYIFTPPPRTSLSYLTLNNTGATGTLTFPGLTSIGTLSLQYQKLMTGVDLTGLTSANTVECLNNTAQTSLNMGALTTVQNLTLQSLAALTTLNISSLTSITQTFALQYCSSLASAPVLTGKTINSLSWASLMFSTVSFTGVTVTGAIAFSSMTLSGTVALPSSGTYSVNFQTVGGFTNLNFGTANVINLTLYSCVNLLSLTVPPGNYTCMINYCSALMSLTVGSQPSCTYFNLISCGSIASLNLTGIAMVLYSLTVTYCGLLTTGLTLRNGTLMQGWYGYIDLRGNNLTTACINAIFTALGNTVLMPTIQLDGNVGESSSNVSIATSMGWIETPGGVA